MQPIRTLTDILDDGAIVSVERQRRLAELVGTGAPFGDRWSYELDAGVLAFRGPGGVLESPANVIGTAAPGPGTWMWSWHNVNGLSDEVVARSARVLELGQRLGIPELTACEVPLRGEPRTDAVEYAVAAGLVNGGLPHYTVDVGNGTIVAFLVEGPRFALPAPSCATGVTVIGEVLMGGAAVDLRRAVTAYAELRGFGLEQTGPAVVLTAADGRVVVTFDELGRIASLDGHLAAD